MDSWLERLTFRCWLCYFFFLVVHSEVIGPNLGPPGDGLCDAATLLQRPNGASATQRLALDHGAALESAAPSSTLPPDMGLAPNAQLTATYKGLNFMLAPDQTDPGSESLLDSPEDRGSALDPRAHRVWTEAGLEVTGAVQNLSAKGNLEDIVLIEDLVICEDSKSKLLPLGGVFRLGLSIAVDDSGRLAVKVVKLHALNIDLAPAIGISCVSTDLWNSIPCGIIWALQGEVPGWLVDSLVFLFESKIEDLLKGIIEFKLNMNLHSIPTDFPLAFQTKSSCLKLGFTMLGLSDSQDVKMASVRALAHNTCSNRPPFPVPGLVPPGNVNSSMFSLAVSGSVPNSILYEVHQDLLFTHTVYPEDLPNGSALGLDTNSMALAFYCPWLSTQYAFQCPLWSPCGVSATIQTSGPPYVDMAKELKIELPLSVDFHVLDSNETSNNSEFLWRINLTAHAAFIPALGGTGCNQTLQGTLSSLDVSWIDVTKTQDDSWVATALSINIFLPLLLNPLVSKINERLALGIPLKPLPVGDSLYSLSNTSLILSLGKLTLTTDVLLTENCTEAH
eukprot:Skav235466  [mRNA]  locus=scaffold1451:107786:111679:+ [translate_table: standard]